MRIAVHGAAGELQMEVHEIGLAHVSEADQRRTMRRALQMQLGPCVLPEGAKGFTLPDWSGRILGPDVVIAHMDRPGYFGFAECKWCREDTIFETFWDLFKLATALRRTQADRAYLVVGAQAEPWARGGLCADLINTGSWQTRELFERYRRAWEWLLKDTKARPAQLPDTVDTELVAQVPIHLANGPDWELRAVSLCTPGEAWVPFEDGWPVLQGVGPGDRPDDLPRRVASDGPGVA
jgi:hypothetical protein